MHDEELSRYGNVRAPVCVIPEESCRDPEQKVVRALFAEEENCYSGIASAHIFEIPSSRPDFIP